MKWNWLYPTQNCKQGRGYFYTQHRTVNKRELIVYTQHRNVNKGEFIVYTQHRNVNER